jgi:histone deacetylase 6
MEGDSDVLVEDGYIMASTEINDVQETVDPAIFALEDDVVSPVPSAHQTAAFIGEIGQDPDRSAHGAVSPGLRDTSQSSSTESSDSSDLDVEMTMPSHQAIVQVLIPRRRFEPLPYSSTQTGLVYDVRMRFHTDPPSSTISADEIHPEDPRRIFSIYQALVDAGLVHDDDDNASLEPDFRLYRIEARNAHASEICLIHTRDHYVWVKALRG